MTTGATARTTFHIEQEVTINTIVFGWEMPGVYVMAKVPGAGEVNYIGYPKDNPEGRAIAAPAHCWEAYDANAQVTAQADAPSAPHTPALAAGTIVTFTGPRGGISANEMFIVLGAGENADAVRLVIFGGGTEYPSIPISSLGIVDSTTLIPA
jgi:hypothetical protein